MIWSETFRAARGILTQGEAAKAVSLLLSIRVVQEWESGRRQPPAWVQGLILEKLRKKKTTAQGSNDPSSATIRAKEDSK